MDSSHVGFHGDATPPPYANPPGFAEAIVATSGALLCALDRRGRIVAFNPACERATGYPFAEVRGRPFWDLFLTADELPRVRAVFSDLRDGHFPNSHENHWRARDGRLRLIAWENTATRDADGAVAYVIASGIDVTEQRAAEEAARTRAAQLALLTAQLPAHVWTTDRDLHLTSFTGGGFAGRDAEIGARIGLTLAQFFGTGDPDHPPITAHHRALAGEPASYEITVAGREYEVRVEPLRDEARAIIGCVGLGVDVTERRAGELRAARARAVFAQAPIGFIMADLDRRIIACNREAEHILGFREDEMRRSTFPLATHPDDAARDMALYRDLVAGRRDAYAIEKRYVRKDGRIIQGRLVVALVRDPFGKPLQAIGMLIDITALKAAEAGLTEAQHQIGLLLEEAARRDRQLQQQDSKLTHQEWEIMLLITQGWKNKRIAARLHIAEATVKTHIRHINEKLGTTDRQGVAALARDRGWPEMG